MDQRRDRDAVALAIDSLPEVHLRTLREATAAHAIDASSLGGKKATRDHVSINLCYSTANEASSDAER